MSASEKLKELDAARGEFAWEESVQKFSLFDVFPQIVALVEAAEVCGLGATHEWTLQDQREDLRNALAALEDALGESDVIKGMRGWIEDKQMRRNP